MFHAGYQFARLFEYTGSTCYCGDTGAGQKYSELYCDQTCRGDNSYKCGGALTCSVYRVRKGTMQNNMTALLVSYQTHNRFSTWQRGNHRGMSAWLVLITLGQVYNIYRWAQVKAIVNPCPRWGSKVEQLKDKNGTLSNLMTRVGHPHTTTFPRRYKAFRTENKGRSAPVVKPLPFQWGNPSEMDGPVFHPDEY